MRLRSLLYVPADNQRFIARAHERGADAVILDLEDAVRPESKAAARDGLVQTVSAVGRNGAAVFVRVNADPNLQWLDAEAACRAGATGLYIAKARSAEALDTMSAHLLTLAARIGRPPMVMVALIEDPEALFAARAIAQLPGVIGLSLGSEDFALATGAKPLPEVVRTPKLLVHYAAKAAGKLSLGLLRSVAGYADLDALRDAAAEAKAFGFDGASCIHPSAISILNAAFSPTAEEIAWAESVVSGYEAAPTGATALGGTLIDAPVIARARQLLATRRGS